MDTQSLPVMPVPQEYLVEDFFSLAITQKTTSTKIIMQLLYNQVNTQGIATIVELLEEKLPNVLYTQCFNDDNLPFSVEVKHTEIGHLFEHILLEYLCQLRIAKGAKKASYSGRTKWNWIRDPRGKFHIQVTCGKKDTDILPIALDKTITLMKIILRQHQAPLFMQKQTFGLGNGSKNGRRFRK